MPVFWWMELDHVSLKGTAVYSSVFWGVYGLGMALGSTSFKVHGCFLFFWRINIVCLALELVGSWVELGVSLGMETFGWALVC